MRAFLMSQAPKSILGRDTTEMIDAVHPYVYKYINDIHYGSMRKKKKSRCKNTNRNKCK